MLLNAQSRSFHLFQRVVGFRQLNVTWYKEEDDLEFPSLSESSGFPTDVRKNMGSIFTNCSFHLFQRVVGFRLIEMLDNIMLTFFSFHLFQRVVGFRP